MGNEFEGVNERNRNVANEKKQMKQQKDEASKFRQMEENLAKMKSESYRFRLFHIETEVKNAVAGIQTADDDLATHSASLNDLEQEIKLKQADLAKTLRQKSNITKNARKLLTSLNKKKLKANAMEKKVKSLESERNKLEQEKAEIDEKTSANEEKLNELETEKQRVSDLQKEFESERKSEAKEIEFAENEYEIYQNVKNQIRQETASLNSKKSALENIFVRKQDELDNVFFDQTV